MDGAGDDASLPIAIRRTKRSRNEVNYKEPGNIKLPKASLCKTDDKTDDKLYPVTILEQNAESTMMKIHYVGYSSEYDEWKDLYEVETLESEEVDSAYQPYSLYTNLRIKIKQALTCGRKSSPIVNVVMGFDLLQFNGGLKTVGIPFKKVQGVQHYKIKHYRDMNPFLGSSWHFRGLNANGDYGYIEMETVDFCLRKSRTLIEYLPPCHDQTPHECSTDTGFIISFSFVCNYGSITTFGKDKKIFYQ
jgi:hypothetical protein